MKLTDLRKLYSQRLKQVNSDWLTVEIHPTRLKEHILLTLGDECQTFTKGRDVLIPTKTKSADLLSEAMSQDLFEVEAKKINRS